MSIHGKIHSSDQKDCLAGTESQSVDWPCLVAALGLLVPLVLLLRYPLAQISNPASIDYNEGWNAYRQFAAAAGVPLYGAHPALTVTNYPPLSFHLIGLFHRLGFDVTLAGRTMALCSTSILPVLAFLTGRTLLLSRPASCLAGLLFLTFLTLLAPERVVANDPQMAALALSAGAALAYLRMQSRQTSRRTGWLIGSAVLFILSEFTKHNLVGLPLAVGLHQLLGRRWRELILWCSVMALTSVPLLMATSLIDGPFFLEHMLRPRAMRYVGGSLITLRYLLAMTVPLVVGSLWATLQPVKSGRGLVPLALVLCHLASLLFVMGDGVSTNIFFDSLYVACLAAAAGAAELRIPHMLRPNFVMLVLLPIIVLTKGTLAVDASHARAQAALAQPLQQMRALVRDARGAVVCEDLLLCFDAGQPDEYDAYYVRDQEMAGALDPRVTVARLQRRAFALVELGAPGDQDQHSMPQGSRFGKPFMQALMHNYHRVLSSGGYVVLEPDRQDPK